MDVIQVLLGMLTIILLGAVVYLWRELNKEEQAMMELHNKVNLLSLESKITPQFNADNSELRDSLSTLAKRLFQLIKSRYNLDVTTYSELVDQLTKLDVPLKSELIDFFSNMVVLEYSNVPLPPAKKRKLKEEVINLIKRLGAH